MKNDKNLNDINANSFFNIMLPRNWLPFIILCRLDRPIGIWLTILPCFSALIICSDGIPSIRNIIIFSIGAILMRSIGCTFNDICDQEFDKKVTRTCLRPLATGSITQKKAITFLLVQLLTCSSLLLFINSTSKLLSIILIPIVIIYPLCKRFTYWPQIILGICFNWGILIAWSEVTHFVTLNAFLLWLGAIFWQIGYDSIYAYVDADCDEAIGLKSTAVLFSDNGKIFISLFYILAIIFWILAGHNLKLNFSYYYGIAIIFFHFIWQIFNFQPKNQKKNFYLFIQNIWVGIILLSCSLTGTIFTT
ncbi:4-hydroxybenzoate octaprenyltransferase [Candidatus Kinetoplastibacterium oncopeltii TCC290E]|uniref:4-hydroxybenzoate octaprenyltransferase n=1 Tax=Candidatus Kinetoplastidibacterium stringomonadis TCC290E TaxID=1208920 RepID=M1LT01_9PROT|nr:4-hydroxybenzoate octaprenyltransferase [Candidatus Kinetoplastibacterium oncopeltii]AGF48667.1 4-hydroxybenzoate octaprenyltransferase [Candidatus Kinetoplastibacterium oncopeltii TCC290E]